ncbi:MAG TPA: chorismate-binding protein, partial [Verrucomicrobiae bacterium]
MRPLIHEIATAHTPESLVGQLRGLPRQSETKTGELGVVLLRSALFDSLQARYSFVAANPFLTFQSSGSRCEIFCADSQLSTFNSQPNFGNPWHLLDSLMSRYELLDEVDLPFPLGGCFGYWGYDLKNFTEPKLPRRAVNDLELPDCHVGFYDSLVVFDHRLGKTWIVSTGLDADGSRSEARAREQAEFWRTLLTDDGARTLTPALSLSERERENRPPVSGKSKRGDAARTLENSNGRTTALPLPGGEGWGEGERHTQTQQIISNLSRADFLSAVERAQRYIRAGDIYQANLSQRLTAPCEFSGWGLFERLSVISPAPFSAFLDCGEFQIASSSPELFLRMS